MGDIKRMEKQTDEKCDMCGVAAGAEVGQVRQLLLRSDYSKKPVRSQRAWKKDPKAVTKDTTALNFPMTVRPRRTRSVREGSCEGKDWSRDKRG